MIDAVAPLRQEFVGIEPVSAAEPPQAASSISMNLKIMYQMTITASFHYLGLFCQYDIYRILTAHESCRTSLISGVRCGQ